MIEIHEWFSKEKFVSARDRPKQEVGAKSTVGIPLCSWERNSHGGLVASWRVGCKVGSGTAVSRHTRIDDDGDPGELEATHVQLPVSAPRAERLFAAAVIAVLYVMVGLALVLASAGTVTL